MKKYRRLIQICVLTTALLIIGYSVGSAVLKPDKSIKIGSMAPEGDFFAYISIKFDIHGIPQGCFFCGLQNEYDRIQRIYGNCVLATRLQVPKKNTRSKM